MRRSLDLLILIICLLPTPPAEARPNPAAPTLGGLPHYVYHCDIVDEAGKPLRRYPAPLCLYHRDGRVFVSNEKGLSAYDRKMRLLWHRNYFLHHQMNWSEDGKAIVALGSEFPTIDGKVVRGDALYVIHLDGSLAKRFSFHENWKDIQAVFPHATGELIRNPNPWEANVHTNWELMHVNSFYEIPQNANAARIPAFAPGNYIVFDPWIARIMIFDRDLKRIVWHVQYKLWNPLHDVQVLPSGNLLMYVNSQRIDLTPGSSLQEYDPFAKAIVWSYEPNDSKRFNSPHSGGIQLLPNGNILFSDLTDGRSEGVVITRGGKELARIPAGIIDKKTGKRTPIQQMKATDLTSFLKRNRGL